MEGILHAPFHKFYKAALNGIEKALLWIDRNLKWTRARVTTISSSQSVCNAGSSSLLLAAKAIHRIAFTRDNLTERPKEM